jgi:CcmD family protein
VLATLALVALAALLLGAAPVRAAPADDGFVPVPAGASPAPEALSAPLLVKVAYGAIWAAVCGYLVGLWRRSRRLEDEIEELRHRLDRQLRPGTQAPAATEASR